MTRRTVSSSNGMSWLVDAELELPIWRRAFNNASTLFHLLRMRSGE